jgi:hypothetical protein
VLTLTVTGRHVDTYRWTPAVIRNGVPQPVTDPDDAAAAVDDWTVARRCTGLTP